MFILDNDHLIIAQRDSQPEANRLRRRMKQHRESDFHLTMDLRIASIALSHNYQVLTRNTIDFGRVTDLRIEDWTTETN